MFISRGRKCKPGYTLVEMMFAVGVFGIIGLSMSMIFMFSVRSYASLANYSVLDQYNRQALDQVTFELRQAQQVTGYASNATSRNLSLLNGDGLNVTYTFDSSKQRLVRSASDGSSKVLLTNCALLNFGLYMRPPTNGTFDVYPVDTSTNLQSLVKVVQLTWRTSISICPTMITNSEDIQTARIVIRKQH